jgi:PAS domain S-box-containing protein
MEPATDETRTLKRCVRELAALSVLSAAWGRTGPQGIADSLADVMLRSLPQVDFVYARVKLLADGDVLHAVRTIQSLEPSSRPQEIARALDPLLKDGSSDSPLVVPNPIGEGKVRLAVVPIGYEGDCGVLIAGSRQLDFPGPTDQLLLGVAANQAAVVLQHHRSEEALRRQAALLHNERELLRVTLASIGDAVVTTDAQERVTFLNPVAEVLTGWNQGTAVGMPLPQVFQIVNERTRQPVANPALRALQEGVVVGLANRTVLIARDGTERPIDDSAAPIRDAVGRTVGAVLVFRDISERKRAADAAQFLAEASAALATVVDYESTLQKVANLAVPYFADWAAVDVAGEGGSLRRLAVAHQEPEKVRLAQELVRRYPPAPDAPAGSTHVFRTGQPELVGEVTDEMLVQAAKDEAHLRLLRELGLKSYICLPLIVSGKAFGVLTFAAAESGRRYTDSDLALGIELSHRAAIAVENMQLYRELRQSDRRKDEFLATLAHELRNPMAPIRNGLQVLKMAGDPAARDQARAMMERQLGQLVRLVDDLLDISRITSNKLELRKARIELRAVIENAVETARPQIEASGHTLVVDLPPQPVYLDADLTRLAQVFWNLLNNSAKYTDPGGRISLSAVLQGGEVIVAVRDTGIGIPASAQPRLFELFSQVDRSLERSQGGLGIGLALVKGLTEMHGGTVEVSSAGSGQGSTFVVHLPVAQGMPAQEQPPPSGWADGQKRRILVVDDNRDGAASLAMLLSLTGHDARTAHDGLEAVELAEAFRPEVIVLDIGLPKLNGYDACRRIREQAWGKTMVIIAATGWGQEEDRRRSTEAGFDAHLVKPVDLAALHGLVAGLESPP